MSAFIDDTEHDQRVLSNVTWLAAHLPSIVAAECPTGDEITAVTIYGSEIRIQMDRVAVAERVAEHLGFTEHGQRPTADGRPHHHWSGYRDDTFVYVVAIGPEAVA